DDPNHPMNAHQLQLFRELTADCNIPRSLSATGGILLGEAYHFEVTRPGIGLYGGAPFLEANPVVQIDIPVIQTRPVTAGETVGYSNTWTATTPRQIATISAGYADGILRAMGPNTLFFTELSRTSSIKRFLRDLLERGA
ncbi:alanine racemase, partial [bacterium]|nr:alanine racemase [bacterium]